MSRGLSVSPLSAQVFPYRQLVGGGKVLDSFKPIVVKKEFIRFTFPESVNSRVPSSFLRGPMFLRILGLVAH